MSVGSALPTAYLQAPQPDRGCRSLFSCGPFDSLLPYADQGSLDRRRRIIRGLSRTLPGPSIGGSVPARIYLKGEFSLYLFGYAVKMKSLAATVVWHA